LNGGIGLYVVQSGAATSLPIVLSRLVRAADLPAVLVLGWTSWLVVPWSLGALVQVRSTAAERARHDLVRNWRAPSQSAVADSRPIIPPIISQMDTPQPCGNLQDSDCGAIAGSAVLG
jgi:hypothetical protein